MMIKNDGEIIEKVQKSPKKKKEKEKQKRKNKKRNQRMSVDEQESEGPETQRKLVKKGHHEPVEEIQSPIEINEISPRIPAHSN